MTWCGLECKCEVPRVTLVSVDMCWEPAAAVARHRRRLGRIPGTIRWLPPPQSETHSQDRLQPCARRSACGTCSTGALTRAMGAGGGAGVRGVEGAPRRGLPGRCAPCPPRSRHPHSPTRRSSPFVPFAFEPHPQTIALSRSWKSLASRRSSLLLKHSGPGETVTFDWPVHLTGQSSFCRR